MLVKSLKNQTNFNDTEKIIANYIVDYPKDFIFESIDTIAKKTFTSTATIVRFSKKMGFCGFTDLKIKVASELSTFERFEELIEADMPFLPNSSIETIVETFYKLPSQVLKESFSKMDQQKLLEAAMMLQEADSITLLGSGSSQLIVSNLYYNLRRIGMNVTDNHMVGFQVMYKKRKQKNEVALIVSNFGTSKQVKDWVYELKSLGVKIILITTNQDSPFVKVADCSIVINLNENQVWKMGSFVSRTALTYALDCIYAILFNMDYMENVKSLYDTSERLGFNDAIDSEYLDLFTKE